MEVIDTWNIDDDLYEAYADVLNLPCNRGMKPAGRADHLAKLKRNRSLKRIDFVKKAYQRFFADFVVRCIEEYSRDIHPNGRDIEYIFRNEYSKIVRKRGVPQRKIDWTLTLTRKDLIGNILQGIWLLMSGTGINVIKEDGGLIESIERSGIPNVCEAVKKDPPKKKPKRTLKIQLDPSAIAAKANGTGAVPLEVNIDDSGSSDDDDEDVDEDEEESESEEEQEKEVSEYETEPDEPEDKPGKKKKKKRKPKTPKKVTNKTKASGKPGHVSESESEEEKEPDVNEQPIVPSPNVNEQSPQSEESSKQDSTETDNSASMDVAPSPRRIFTVPYRRRASTPANTSTSVPIKPIQITMINPGNEEETKDEPKKKTRGRPPKKATPEKKATPVSKRRKTPKQTEDVTHTDVDKTTPDELKDPYKNFKGPEQMQIPLKGKMAIIFSYQLRRFEGFRTGSKAVTGTLRPVRGAPRVAPTILKGELVPVIKILFQYDKSEDITVSHFITHFKQNFKSLWKSIDGSETDFKKFESQFDILIHEYRAKKDRELILKTWNAVTEEDAEGNAKANQTFDKIIEWVKSKQQRTLFLPDGTNPLNAVDNLPDNVVKIFVEQIEYIRDRFVGQTQAKLALADYLHQYITGLHSIGDVSFNFMFYGEPGTGTEKQFMW